MPVKEGGRDSPPYCRDSIFEFRSPTRDSGLDQCWTTGSAGPAQDHLTGAALRISVPQRLRALNTLHASFQACHEEASRLMGKETLHGDGATGTLGRHGGSRFRWLIAIIAGSHEEGRSGDFFILQQYLAVFARNCAQKHDLMKSWCGAAPHCPSTVRFLNLHFV